MAEEFSEFESSMGQVVIGVRRSGKSTLCHKVLLEHGIRYGYVNLDDDRLIGIKAEDLNTVLSCVYQLYGTDVPYLFLDEIQDVDGWHFFVNRLLRNKMKIFVTGSNAKLLSSELATHLTGRYNEIRLFPFSFAEYCTFHQIDTAGITTKAEASRKSAFLDYIGTGGFPDLQRIRNKRGYIESLISAILAGENIGWGLENVVYIKHLRRCAYDFRDVYYYKANPRAKEVDFVVCDKDKALELIQVAYEIDTQKSFNRETSALVKATSPLHCDKLTLIAFSPTRDIEIDGKTIHIISAVEWLLS